jgi:uncharacterized phiE125 gp8 family phage protein
MSLSAKALVTLAQVKNYLKIDNSDYDDTLEIMIEAATLKTEDYCATWWLKAETTEEHIGEGHSSLFLHRAPVTEVDSITLTNLDGEEETLDTDDYIVYESAGMIYSLYLYDRYKIEITYTAGFLDSIDDAIETVPEAVLAVLMTIADWWNNPTGILSQSITGIGALNFEAELQLPGKAKAKLSSLRQRIL